MTIPDRRVRRPIRPGRPACPRSSCTSPAPARTSRRPPRDRARSAARGVEQRLVHTGQHYDEQMSRRLLPPSSACPSPTSTSASAPAPTRSRPPRSWSAWRRCSSSVRPDARGRLRRRELHRRRGAGRRQAADPAGPRRGRAAQLRLTDARGGQPAASPTGSPTCCSPPAPTRVAHLARRGRRAAPDPLRRQPDDRHAAGATSTGSTSAAVAHAARPRRALRRRHAAPPGQRRRPDGCGRLWSSVAPRVADQLDGRAPAAPARSRRRWTAPGLLDHPRRPRRRPAGLRRVPRPGPRRRRRGHRLGRRAGGDHRPRRARA